MSLVIIDEYASLNSYPSIDQSKLDKIQTVFERYSNESPDILSHGNLLFTTQKGSKIFALELADGHYIYQIGSKKGNRILRFFGFFSSYTVNKYKLYPADLYRLISINRVALGKFDEVVNDYFQIDYEVHWAEDEFRSILLKCFQKCLDKYGPKYSLPNVVDAFIGMCIVDPPFELKHSNNSWYLYTFSRILEPFMYGENSVVDPHKRVQLISGLSAFLSAKFDTKNKCLRYARNKDASYKKTLEPFADMAKLFSKIRPVNESEDKAPAVA